MLTQEQREYLRIAVEQIEGLEGQIAEMNRDKANEYKAARAKGLDATILRALIAKRRRHSKDPVGFDAANNLLNAYEAALETPSRARARERVDPETGEIITLHAAE